MNKQKHIFYLLIGVMVMLLAVFRLAHSRSGTTASIGVTPTVVEPASTALATARPPATSVKPTQATSDFKIHSGANPNTNVSTEKIPKHITGLMNNPKSRLTPELVERLSPKDKDILIKLYRDTKDLSLKRSLTFALGIVGDEEVVALFTNALYSEYAGRSLTSRQGSEESDEERVLVDTVSALGFLANKYDSAYELIKNGMDTRFWQDKVKWVSKRGADTVGLLTEASIQAIGLSGRPDVMEFIEKRKDQDLINRTGGVNDQYARSVDGGIVDAAYFYDLARKNGYEYMEQEFFSHDLLTVFRAWKQTENGQRWAAWSEKARQR